MQISKLFFAKLSRSFLMQKFDILYWEWGGGESHIGHVCLICGTKDNEKYIHSIRISFYLMLLH